MEKFAFIAAGGALGALLRYLISGLTHRFLDPSFPWGTLAVNLIGCFVIGVLWAATERAPFSPKVHLFIFTGTLGALTTFSTYGLESLHLLWAGEVKMGLANILASNLLGLAAVLAGVFLFRLLMARAA